MKKITLHLFFILFFSISVFSQIDNSIEYPLLWKRFPSQSEIKNAYNTFQKDYKSHIYESAERNGQAVISYNSNSSALIKYHGILKTELKYLPKEYKKYMISGLSFVNKVSYKSEIKGLKPVLEYEWNEVDLSLVTLYFDEKDNVFYFVENTFDPEHQASPLKSVDYYLNDIKKNLDLIKGAYKDVRFVNHQMYPGWATDNIVSENSPTTSNSSGQKTSDTNIPWDVVIGAIIGAGVIAAIRKKLNAKKGKKKKGDKDKKEPADYILQLNQNTFNLNLNEPQNLVVKVWKVTEKGKHLTNASIRVTTSDKALKIMPFSNIGTLDSQLTLKDNPTNNPFNITITATSEGHSFQKTVKISTGAEKQIIVKTNPNNTHSLRPNLDILLTCYAKVVDENGKTLSKETKNIKFKPQSNWIDLSDPVMDGEWIAINMGASDPNANAPVSHPPKSVVLSMIMDAVEENEQILQNDLEIQLLDCKIDTNIDTIALPVSDEQTEVTFIAYIEDCDGSIPWQFEALYLTDDDKPDKPLSTIELEQLSDIKAQITVTGPILKPKEGEKYLRKKLVIKAQQKEEKALERHVFVTVSKEGLYLERGATKNDTIKFTAKGEYTHELEFGLYVYDEETNDIIVDKLGLQNLDFELIDKDKKLKNINSVLKPEVSFDDYVNTTPHARYILEVANKFPGFGDYYNLHYRVKVLIAKYDNSLEFEKIITLKVQDYGIGEGFPDWQKAYDECKYTILEYVPDSDKQRQLLDMLEKHKFQFDIEGMVAFRKMIWKTARNLMLNKRDGYLALANWYDAIIDTLDWVVWMGDIAFQVVLATYTGAGVALAASAFKETFLTGVRLAIEGKSVDDFVKEEIGAIKEMIYSTAKGRLINTQTIEKFYKGNKVKVWAIYAVATFYMQYHRSGSIPQAAKDTARQLRDEAIIRFLHGKVMEENTRLKEKELATKEENSGSNGKKLTKGKNDYEIAESPPDVSGYTKRSIVAIQKIANKLKVEIITRPTNAAARKLLKAGQAVAKKMFVKNKTINELDTYLGASKENIGKVGSFKPKFNRAKMKNLSKQQFEKIVKRYKQRRREYVNQAEHLKQNSKKLYVKNGVVYDKSSNKPFTGDIDIFDIRGPHGEKISRALYKKVVDELIKSNVTNVEHGAHLWWQRWKGGSVKDIRTQEGIFNTIAKGHSKGKENLVSFRASSNINSKPKSVYYKGRTDVKNIG